MRAALRSTNHKIDFELLGFGGTEGFMAPEIMKHNGEEEYTEKVQTFLKIFCLFFPSISKVKKRLSSGGLFLIWNVLV